MTSVAFRPAPYTPTVDLPAPYPKETAFPLSLTPIILDANKEEIVQGIREVSETGAIRKLLNSHGAIYFQNLGLKDAHDFSKFAHAFGWIPHEDIGNPVRRTILAKNVATANEGPNTKPVYPHNEFGLSPHYPAYVFFHCISAPETGGETPINNSIVLYKQLAERHPEFVDTIKAKGVKYQLFYPNGPRDQVTSAGNTVLQAYGASVIDSDNCEAARQKIEEEIRRLPTATWEWVNQSPNNPLGDLRVWQHLPAVRDHPQTGQPAFFNNVVSRFLNSIDEETLEPPHVNRDGRYQPPPFYGDGSLIPREYLDTAVDIIRQTRAMVTWNEGDVILLDNHAVQHAREPWTGNRKLLASLWDEP